MVCARIVSCYCGHTLVSTWKIGFQNVRQESARTIAQINDASKQMDNLNTGGAITLYLRRSMYEQNYYS